MIRRVRLVQLDGKLPNYALMRLSSWYRSTGAEVHLTRDIAPAANEGIYDLVLGSVLFDTSAARVDAFRRHWPSGILGGRASGSGVTVEDVIGGPWASCDYRDYPDYSASLGFSQRGCRLDCDFCRARSIEGRPAHANTIHGIWRGPGFPKNIHLLDNDFFGGPHWRERLEEIREGKFRVCFNQGLNLRVITQEQANELATIEYRDDQFCRRRLYGAWDNIGEESSFFRGVEKLARAGIPPKHLMIYMLVGFDPEETWQRVLYRFHRMSDLGIRPYPMVFRDRQWDDRGTDPRGRSLKHFQRWVVTGLYRAKGEKAVPWDQYIPGLKRRSDASTIRVEAAE